MLKLLFMLIAFLGVGMVLMGLRQRRMELQASSAEIYQHIRERQETLLGEEAQIARETNPLTLASSLKNQGVPVGPALELRDTHEKKPGGEGPVETDLVAPVLGGQ